jgi:hypothetical protein
MSELIDDTNENKNNSTHRLTKRRKIMLSAIVASVAAVLIGAGLPLQSSIAQEEMDPTQGYNIHVTVNRHDSSHLNAQMDHFCKLDPRIVAVCQLYAHDDAGPQLAQVEFIITDEQYLQLPDREKPNWHNHAVELTPQRGMPSCIELPEGLDCNTLVGILQGTYGKVITLWDPADDLPNYPPYAFLVDSPFALGQDVNDDLECIYEVGGGENSSVGVVFDIVPCEPPLDVEIDILPGIFPNEINPTRSNRLIPVAILTNEAFDASTVDAASVEFGPNGASAFRTTMQDADNDGDTDMVLNFRTGLTGIFCGLTSATLNGKTVNGAQIAGSDSIVTVGPSCA